MRQKKYLEIASIFSLPYETITEGKELFAWCNEKKFEWYTITTSGGSGKLYKKHSARGDSYVISTGSIGKVKVRHWEVSKYKHYILPDDIAREFVALAITQKLSSK